MERGTTVEKNNRKELARAYRERKIVGGVYAIKNTANEKVLLAWDTDLQGSRNKFDFSVMTGSCPSMKLQKDWQSFGKDTFVFEVVEELEKKSEQTEREFCEDLMTLEELCRDRFDENLIY